MTGTATISLGPSRRKTCVAYYSFLSFATVLPHHQRRRGNTPASTSASSHSSGEKFSSKSAVGLFPSCGLPVYAGRCAVFIVQFSPKQHTRREILLSVSQACVHCESPHSQITIVLDGRPGGGRPTTKSSDLRLKSSLPIFPKESCPARYQLPCEYFEPDLLPFPRQSTSA